MSLARHSDKASTQFFKKNRATKIVAQNLRVYKNPIHLKIQQILIQTTLQTQFPSNCNNFCAVIRMVFAAVHGIGANRANIKCS